MAIFERTIDILKRLPRLKGTDLFVTTLWRHAGPQFVDPVELRPMDPFPLSPANRPSHAQTASMDDHDTLTDKLLSDFKDRGLSVKRDTIISALQDPVTGPQNAQWVSQHLTPDTLLSQEELAL